MIDLNALQKYGAMASPVYHFPNSQTRKTLIDGVQNKRILVWAYEFYCKGPSEFQFQSSDVYDTGVNTDLGCHKWFVLEAAGEVGKTGHMVSYATKPGHDLTITTVSDAAHSVALWYTLT